MLLEHSHWRKEQNRTEGSPPSPERGHESCRKGSYFLRTSNPQRTTAGSGADHCWA